MSNPNLCPSCNNELNWNEGFYQCKPCHSTYKKAAYCPDCEAELERLLACGAESYFCNSCNEQKSKSRVKIRFEPIGSPHIG